MGIETAGPRGGLPLLAGLLLGLAMAAGRLEADQAPIAIDDDLGDWGGVVPAYADPGGDGGGIDFGRLWIADDPRFLFLRVELGIEIDASEGNDLRLYLDTDADAATGLPVAGIGAELEWRFGSRNGTFYTGGQTTVYHEDIRFRQAPAVTASDIELAVGRDAVPDGSHPLFSGPVVRVALVDGVGGDQVPDPGDIVSYTFDQGVPPPPLATPLDRQDPSDLRLVTYNVLHDGPWDLALEPLFGRQLAAVAPDLLCFQEIYDHSPAQTAQFVADWIPLGPGESWSAVGNQDCKIVSRFPFLGSWPLDGNLAALVDATPRLGSEILVIDAHLPCCSNDDGRQLEIDRIMAFIRDAEGPGGSLDLAPDTPILVTGDLNLVGLSQQLVTLLTGDIVNPQFGPDFPPDWDGSDLANLLPLQTELRMGYTWRNDQSSFWPGHLDYQIYTDHVLEAANRFVLYTPEMSDPAAHGMQPGDSTASDHLLSCADYRPPASLPAARLVTTPPDGGVLDFGAVRVGETGLASLLAANGGDPGSLLTGTFPAAGGGFGPAVPEGFGPLGAGEGAARDYLYTPPMRGGDGTGLVVTSDGGNAAITLIGRGVGPLYESAPPPGSTLRPGPGGRAAGAVRLALGNGSADDDGGDPSRTDLTLLAATITGPDAARFRLEGFLPGRVLSRGEFLSLTIRFRRSPVEPGRLHRATLSILTDEGSPLGTPGRVYAYDLEAWGRSP